MSLERYNVKSLPITDRFLFLLSFSLSVIYLVFHLELGTKETYL